MVAGFHILMLACEYCFISNKNDSIEWRDRTRKKKTTKKFQLIISCCAKNVFLFSCLDRCVHIRCRRLRCSRRLLVPTPTVINLISVAVADWFLFLLKIHWNHNENKWFVENYLYAITYECVVCSAFSGNRYLIASREISDPCSATQPMIALENGPIHTRLGSAFDGQAIDMKNKTKIIFYSVSIRSIVRWHSNSHIHQPRERI